MPPFVGLPVELCRKLSVRFRRDDRGYATIQQVIAQPIRVKSSIRQQMPSRQAADQGSGLAQIMGLPWHQTEIDEIAEGIRQSQYLRRYAAARASNGLAKSPPFAPCPERWTLTMVPSIIAYSRSASEANALNIR